MAMNKKLLQFIEKYSHSEIEAELEKIADHDERDQERRKLISTYQSELLKIIDDEVIDCRTLGTPSLDSYLHKAINAGLHADLFRCLLVQTCLQSGDFKQQASFLKKPNMLGKSVLDCAYGDAEFPTKVSRPRDYLEACLDKLQSADIIDFIYTEMPSRRFKYPHPTRLHHAAETGNAMAMSIFLNAFPAEQRLPLLLDKKATIVHATPLEHLRNTHYGNGTPLHVTAMTKQVDVVVAIINCLAKTKHEPKSANNEKPNEAHDHELSENHESVSAFDQLAQAYDHWGQTFLHRAASQGALAIIKVAKQHLTPATRQFLLLSTSSQGETPLLKASRCGNEKCALELLEWEPTVNLPMIAMSNRDGQNIFHTAANQNQLSLFKTCLDTAGTLANPLLEARANVCAQVEHAGLVNAGLSKLLDLKRTINDDGYTVLLTAVCLYRLEITLAILNHPKFQITHNLTTATRVLGSTVMGFLTHRKGLDLLRVLAAQRYITPEMVSSSLRSIGAPSKTERVLNPNYVVTNSNEKVNTYRYANAIHKAARWGDLEMIKILLDIVGKDLAPSLIYQQLTPVIGKTAIDYAKLNQAHGKAILEILQSYPDPRQTNVAGLGTKADSPSPSMAALVAQSPALRAVDNPINVDHDDDNDAVVAAGAAAQLDDESRFNIEL